MYLVVPRGTCGDASSARGARRVTPLTWELHDVVLPNEIRAQKHSKFLFDVRTNYEALALQQCCSHATGPTLA